MKASKDTYQGFLVECWVLEGYIESEDLIITLAPNTHTEELYALLSEFSKSFQMPNKLPPTHAIDHQINVVEGAITVNVRPYRYMHH